MIETYNQSARHQIYVQRFAGHLNNQYDQQAIKNVVNSFLIESYDLPYSQFEGQLNAMQNQVELLASQYFNEVTTELMGFSGDETEFQQRVDEEATGLTQEEITAIILAGIWGAVLATPMVFPDSNTVITYQQYIDRRKASQSKVIRDSIVTSKVTNQTLQQARDNVTGRGGILSTKDKSKNRAAIITLTNHVSSISRAETTKKNSAIGYQWVSVLDSKTSATCRSLAGEVFYFVDNYNPYPPAHDHCRSGIRFIYGREEIVESPTYYNFLKRQSASFQDDVLGPTRGKLFRNGGITSEEFSNLNVDELFRPLTLEQMRERAPKAFEKANLPPP